MLRLLVRNTRLAVFHASRAAGLSRLVGDSAWRCRHLLILCHHGFSIEDEHFWNRDLFQSPETLRSRLEALRVLKANVLPLDEALRRLYARTLPPRAVTLTFDDGFHNFFRVAHPLLREFNYPATVYLSTYYCDRQLPMFPPTLGYLLWKGKEGKLPDFASAFTDNNDSLNSGYARHHTLTAVLRRAEEEGWTVTDKHEFLHRLASTLRVDFDRLISLRLFHLMTPGEVAEVARAEVAIELHTHRHRSPRDRELYIREIKENAAAIQRITGVQPRYFCYPSGVYRRDFEECLAACGVCSATTCYPALAAPTSNPLVLPRFLDTDLNPAVVFESWVTGVGHLVRRR